VRARGYGISREGIEMQKFVCIISENKTCHTIVWTPIIINMFVCSSVLTNKRCLLSSHPINTPEPHEYFVN
jgi:hypothetical protein